MTVDEYTKSSPDPFINPSPLNQGTGRKKVAIIGFEEQNKQTAPLDDPEWDVWGLNMANRLGIHADSQGRFRADLWFDLHQEHAQDELDLRWINACPVPIYLTHSFGINPKHRVLDVKSMMTCIAWRYKRAPATYFASSFAYMTAIAIAQGYTTIGFFGVNLDWGRERVVERGNLEYWIGFAGGCGISLVFSAESKLLSHPGLYGIEYEKEKTGVEQICVNAMRQLLQSNGIRQQLDQDLQARAMELDKMRKEMDLSVQRLIYQNMEVA